MKPCEPFFKSISANYGNHLVTPHLFLTVYRCFDTFPTPMFFKGFPKHPKPATKKNNNRVSGKFFIEYSGTRIGSTSSILSSKMSCYRTDTSAWPVEIHVFRRLSWWCLDIVRQVLGWLGKSAGWFRRYVFFRNPNSENHCWKCWILFWVVHSQRNIGYWWLGFVDDCETLYCTYTDIRHILFLYVYIYICRVYRYYLYSLWIFQRPAHDPILGVRDLEWHDLRNLTLQLAKFHRIRERCSRVSRAGVSKFTTKILCLTQICLLTCFPS